MAGSTAPDAVGAPAHACNPTPPNLSANDRCFAPVNTLPRIYAHESELSTPRALLAVRTARHTGRISLSVAGDGMTYSLALDRTDARALAHELLNACKAADAEVKHEQA